MKYYPYLSIADNAMRNNCSEAAVRKYIKVNGIDRKLDVEIARFRKIHSLIEEEPTRSISDIERRTGYSRNTIKKYLSMTEEPHSNFDTNKVSSFDNGKAINYVKSVSYSQDEILQAILSLYIKGDSFDCDLTYSLGYFYKRIKPPRMKFDKYPQSEDVLPLQQARELPNGSISSVVVDLPFILNTDYSARKSMMSTRFNYFRTLEELLEVNEDMMHLAYRLLSDGGYLIMKTMDFKTSNRQVWTSHFIHSKGVEIGFEVIDIFVLIRKNRVLYSRGEQKCSRKYHSFFYVFRKPFKSVNTE